MLNKYQFSNAAFTEASDEGLSHLVKMNMPVLEELHIGMNLRDRGGNTIREGGTIINKGNFKMMKWISFNPGSDTTAKMSVFSCLRVYSADWQDR